MRKKVDSIVRKNEAVPDMDAPDDAESTRFWCFTDARSTETDRLTITGQSTTNVKATGEGVASLLDTGSGLGCGAARALAGTSATPCGPSLQALVQVMNDAPAGSVEAPGPKAKAKAKSKAKAKAKAVLPGTVAEQRAAARSLTNTFHGVRGSHCMID